MRQIRHRFAITRNGTRGTLSFDPQFWRLADWRILDDRVARVLPIPPFTAERQSKIPARLIAMLFQDSVAAEFEALDREFFTDFVQAGHTKIFAFQQIIAGATD